MEGLSNYMVRDDGKLKYSFFYKQANEERNKIFTSLNRIFMSRTTDDLQRDMISVFEKYDTDKGSKGHNYAPYYEKHLPKTAKKVLEIGVDKGQSILMWHEIYPDAMIYGLDLFIENPIPFQADWVTWFQGSQVDGKMLNEIRHHGPFDFVIEDASHNSRDQWVTFCGLVDCCDLYIVEDLHCCNDEFWRQGLKYENTMLAMMKSGRFPFKHHLYMDKISFIYASENTGE